MNETVIHVMNATGPFAENKDAAARLRDESLKKALSQPGTVEIDFAGVEYATQSFIHALVAHAIRSSPDILERISFSNCTDAVRGVIEIVVDYAQEEA